MTDAEKQEKVTHALVIFENGWTELDLYAAKTLLYDAYVHQLALRLEVDHVVV